MVIEAVNLQFAYPGSRDKTIKGVSFSVAAGEIFGILGPSGAGKSTIKKILIGILKNYSGRVKVLEREMRSARPDFYQKVGVAFEVPNLYAKFTALENLQFFRSLYSGETADPLSLLAMVGLEEDAGTRVAAFSKGMRMRLNFCRAFLNNPELIFLDEPTAGLDPVNTKRVKDLILQSKAEGKTIFLATHNMKVAEDICDRVAFIVDGTISLIDFPRALKLRQGKKTVRLEYRENDSTAAENFELRGIGHNAEFLKLLQNKEIETIHTLEASLEDIFIEVTGRGLS
jgi:fluoroquinolone transport system ATP-binding protein